MIRGGGRASVFPASLSMANVYIEPGIERVQTAEAKAVVCTRGESESRASQH